MTKERLSQLKPLEGHRVSLALRNGSRIDDSQLISTGQSRVGKLWLFSNGNDTFVPVEDVIEVWKSFRPAGFGPPERCPGTWTDTLLRGGAGPRSGCVASRPSSP